MESINYGERVEAKRLRAQYAEEKRRDRLHRSTPRKAGKRRRRGR